jgi:Uncharacterized protein conserved in bacteria
MNKKPNITDEERQLFRDAMKGETRINNPTSVTVNKSKWKCARQQARKNTQYATTNIDKVRPSSSTQSQRSFHASPVTGTDILSFNKNGLQHKKFAQLKQGKLKIEATLDLHEHTADEALRATNDFIQRCQNNGFRTVCIIHGKGLYSTENKPVLKNLLNQYLRDHPSVLAFHSAKNNRGGTGAVVVLLKI